MLQRFQSKSENRFPFVGLGLALNFGFQEAHEGVVILDDDDSETVAQMLIYFYSPAYYVDLGDWSCTDLFKEAKRRRRILLPDRKVFHSEDPYPLTAHAKLHGLSKKYDIPGLSKMTGEKFSECVTKEVQADHFYPDEVRQPHDIIDAIRILYDDSQDSDRIFQEAVIYLARRYARDLAGYKSKEVARAFQDLFHSFDEFAWDMMTLNLTWAQFACEFCQQDFNPEDWGEYTGTECACGRRGICGECSQISRLTCHYCSKKGGCRLIDWRAKDHKKEV